MYGEVHCQKIIKFIYVNRDNTLLLLEHDELITKSYGTVRARVRQLVFDPRASRFMPQILIKLQKPFFDQNKAWITSFALVK